MFKQVRDLVSAKGYPLSFAYGPRKMVSPTYASNFVVIQRDRTQTDGIGPPAAAKANPRMLRVRTLGAEALIYAMSALPNAHIGDHERECEKFVDAMLCALYKWGKLAQSSEDLPISEARYLRADERDDVETWPGVVYRLAFRVPRGVYDRAYVSEENAGAARPTGNVTTINNQTQVRMAHGDPDADPETGCGGT